MKTILLWVGLTVADAAACGTTTGAAGTEITGAACDCGQVECAIGKICFKSGNFGECLTAAIAACGASGMTETVSTKACTCGTGNNGGNIFAGEKCAIANDGAGTKTNAAVCPVTAGDTPTDKHCLCGNAQIPNTYYCDHTTTANIGSIPCTVTDGSAASTPICGCGGTAATANSGDRCAATEFCDNSDTANPICLTKKKCDETNGSAANDFAADAACGCGAVECAKDKYCSEGKCYDTTPLAACPATNQTEKAASRCSCGAHVVCETNKYCLVAGASVTCEADQVTPCLTLANSKHDGRAVAGECACGNDLLTTAMGCVNGTTKIATALTTTCTDGVALGASPTQCGCGTHNACDTEKQICDPTGNEGKGTCALLAAIPACTNTNGAATDGNVCKCEAAVCSSTTACKVTTDASNAKTGACAAPDTSTACKAAGTVNTAACTCGKTGNCADTQYCYTAVPNGTCAAATCDTTGLVPWTDADIDCSCGTVSCAKDSACVKYGTDPFSYACLTKEQSEAVKASGAAACTTCDTCETCKECDDTDDKNNAVCIGQFVSTLATAMNSL